MTGVFPDPTNCHVYYFCYDDGTGALAADRYECENLYVFDPSGPKNEYCRLTRNLYCTQAKCTTSGQNILLNYSFWPKSRGQLVASCRGDGKLPYVFRCEAGFEADLKTLPVQCNLVCTRADKAAFPGDSTQYYECIFNGRTWEPKIKSCFRGYYFDGKSKQCLFNPTTAAPTQAPTTAAAATTPAAATTADQAATTIAGATTIADTTIAGGTTVADTTNAATTVADTTAAPVTPATG